MKRNFCFGAAAAALYLSLATHAVTIDFIPPAQTVNLGDTATVGIALGDLMPSELIGGYNLQISYDDSILDFVGVTFGNLLGGPADALQDAPGGAGRIDVVETSLLFDLAALQAGLSALPIFEISFDTLALGVASLGISSALLSDEFGFEAPITGVGTAAITVQAPPASVPEPGTVVLLLLGIAGVVLTRAQRRTTP